MSTGIVGLFLLLILLCALLMKSYVEKIDELRYENTLLWDYFDVTQTEGTWSELEQDAHEEIVQEIHKHIARTRFNEEV